MGGKTVVSEKSISTGFWVYEAGQDNPLLDGGKVAVRVENIPGNWVESEFKIQEEKQPKVS
jgi:hypothetical protein